MNKITNQSCLTVPVSMPRLILSREYSYSRYSHMDWTWKLGYMRLSGARVPVVAAAIGTREQYVSSTDLVAELC